MSSSLQKSVPRSRRVLDRSMLRSRIIEAHYLQQAIVREQTLRAQHPDLWRRADDARIMRNKSQSGLNRTLRAAGCDPVKMELSLKQKMQKLQQLEARNRAEIASLRRR